MSEEQKEFLEKLTKYFEKFPYMRIGQTVECIHSHSLSREVPLFYMKDKDLLNGLNNMLVFIETGKSYHKVK